MSNRTITLTLTDQEAVTLRTILSRVGGCPARSARDYADLILERLEEKRVPVARTNEVADLTGTLHFAGHSKTCVNRAVKEWNNE